MRCPRAASSAAAAAAAAAAANGDKNAVDERGELDEDGYKKRKEGGVTVVSANVECDILERVSYPHPPLSFC